MLSNPLRKILNDIFLAQHHGKPRDRYSFNAKNRERIDDLIADGFIETVGEKGNELAVTRKGDDARRPPLKALRWQGWKPEPRGPGTAERLLTDVDGERLELLA